MKKRIERDFFCRDVLQVAPELLGKEIVLPGLALKEKILITEVEAYRGEEDLACHASKGRTNRTEIMYHEGGHLYIYLIYGMYWMLNVVTGKKNEPQAVLIRGIINCCGPGRLTRKLGIDKSFYGEDLVSSDRIWLKNTGLSASFITTPRIGIDYASEKWKNKNWRFIRSLDA